MGELIQSPEHPQAKVRSDVWVRRKIRFIIGRAYRLGKVDRGLVLCDNCSNPASRAASLELGWTGCGPCVFGEADALEESDFIDSRAEKAKERARRSNGC